MIVSELVHAVARSAGYDAARVANVARYLREGGVLPTGGRGLSAATVEPEHAFDLILGMTVAETAAGAADAVQNFQKILDDNHRWPREEVIKRIDEFAGVIDPVIFCGTARNTFGALIRTEMDRKTVSKLRNHNEEHVELYIEIKWPLPVIEFVFGSRVNNATPPYLFYGGTAGPNDPYKHVPREHSVALYPVILVELAKAFRDA